MRICDNCNGTGWGCEPHPRRPWTGSRRCGCGGPGMPFPVCQCANDLDQEPDLAVMGNVLKMRRS